MSNGLDDLHPRGTFRNIGTNLSTPSARVQIDQVDLEILELLTADGRLPQKKLAERLGMSAPAVADRLSRLAQKGVLAGYSAVVNWDALGLVTVVYISVKLSMKIDRGPIMSCLAASRGVEEVTLVTGGFDLLVRMRVRDNIHLREILMDSIWQMEGIDTTVTMISMGQPPGLDPNRRLLDEVRRELQERSESGE
ncbi:Lrp/AsnC family transcriptional regulator [Pseudarthrobacter sp. fls2-241-R2A-168]|uniref:Lrp/AsnC family transcriptional regulator n=1 Tax=Pseudarthrobacter sp. fls2-241-R2A-168 TaxID=3040304 RepID=UPI00255250A3|nr:Lrp/AsnC family transcriptional regulator [Pseudarthrobacter sp. fls2-241-R2A-168]